MTATDGKRETNDARDLGYDEETASGGDDPFSLREPEWNERRRPKGIEVMLATLDEPRPHLDPRPPPFFEATNARRIAGPLSVPGQERAADANGVMIARAVVLKSS